MTVTLILNKVYIDAECILFRTFLNSFFFIDFFIGIQNNRNSITVHLSESHPQEISPSVPSARQRRRCFIAPRSFLSSILRHRRSIISAQERNLAVPRRMQSPPSPSALGPGLIVRNKEKNNGAPTSPGLVLFVQAPRILVHSWRKDVMNRHVYMLLMMKILHSFEKICQ